ncbi:Sec-independent protein translocase protein [Nostocoides japonicum T1-X7]|uniref:Sec-independent protein translocase protein TatA n=1 Tax=Nostocoides japonicum T1-X7 TaxID=1194083 RepID=A0A077LXV4_9MICO|nr:Sec-independent protein translocase subunit TatA [Tetrasphaera japonica]CCH77712.1 Sec-independent protein translocase protein [Tetrasphaera japonica T1-X7]
MGRGLFEGWHIIILIVLLIALFGAKRLPDAARSLGRSARVFKSEVDEMKKDGKSPASSATVPGETVQPGQGAAPPAPQQPAAPQASTSPVQENAPRTDNSSGAA